MSNPIFRYTLVLFCFLSAFNKITAQVPQDFREDFLLFIDHKQQIPVLILEDSSIYQGYDFKKSKLNNLTGETPLSDLRALKIKGQTYIVDYGCGPVYKFENSNLVRIDKSFRHRNQYNAYIFEHNDQIHFYGGYGLFTSKNIVTHFDEMAKEWYEVDIKSDFKPKSVSRSIGFKKDNQIFTWKGEFKKDSIVPNSITDEEVWKLDLDTRSWSKYGETKQLIPKNSFFLKSFQVLDLLYLVTGGFIYEVDILNNSVTKYEFNSQPIIDLAYDPYTENVIFVAYHVNTKVRNISIHSLKDLTKNALSKKPFLVSSKKEYYWTGGLVLCGVGLFLGYVFYRKKPVEKDFITLNVKAKTITYKNQEIQIEPSVYKLLKYLSGHQSEFIMLNEVNELYANNNGNESHITINKRRDIAVKNLSYKLSTILNVDEKKILIQKRNSEDRRIKEIKLGVTVKINS